MQKASSTHVVPTLALCVGLAAFLVWFQFSSMQEAALNMALRNINWSVIGFVGALVGTTALYTVSSYRVPRHTVLVLAVLIPVSSFLLCVYALRDLLK
jgi:hypothetical protein